MAGTSWAMVLEHFDQPLVIRELSIPTLEAGQILVKIAAAGICGSDVHIWRGKDPRVLRPMILGHEGIGEISTIRGKKVSVGGKKLKVGQRILWSPAVVCGKCYWCTQAEQPELCLYGWAYGIHRSLGQPTYLNGCYSQYTVLDAQTDVFLIEDNDIDPAVFVAASCSGATVAHGIDLCPPREGDVVVVQGPGPLGLFAVAFARDMGASAIVVIGGTEQRLELCRIFGATMVLNRKETSIDERAAAIFELTDGRGADWVIEAVGRPSVYKEGLRLVRRGGTYVSVGVGMPLGSIELDLYKDIALKNLHLQGVWGSHTKHTEMALQLVQKYPEHFSQLVTHRFPLEDATKALQVVQAREGVKTVLVPELAES